jgi:hypothetical protein
MKRIIFAATVAAAVASMAIVGCGRSASRSSHELAQYGQPNPQPGTPISPSPTVNPTPSYPSSTPTVPTVPTPSPSVPTPLPSAPPPTPTVPPTPTPTPGIPPNNPIVPPGTPPTNP